MQSTHFVQKTQKSKYTIKLKQIRGVGVFEEGELQRVDLSKMAENGSVIAKPIVHNGAVYVGGEDTYFYCLDAKTGRKIWTYKTNGVIYSTAAIKDDVLYFGCSD